MIARHHSIGEFHCAAAVGEEEIFLNLTSRGDLATGDEFGRTPLHLAVCGGHKKIVEILVNEAVDVYAADQWGRSPVQLAVATGRKDILRLLLYPNDQRSNGKINAVDKWGYATIHYAVVSGDLEIVKMVCE
ncbi:ankyrin repeat-containing domain protein, partial [Kalaharituber pfeilii]